MEKMFSFLLFNNQHPTASRREGASAATHGWLFSNSLS